MKRSRLTPFPIAGLLLLALAGPATADRAIEEHLELSADGELAVEILSGSLVIHGWDRPELQIKGTVEDDVEDLEISGNGTRAWIEMDTELSHGHSRGRVDLDVDLEIWMPASARLEVDTLSAGIEVSGLAGSLELGSVSGQIIVSGAPAELDAETVSGDVRLDGSGTRTGTPVSVETVSGNVVLRGVGGKIDASTVSGRIELGAVAVVTDADLETVSGSVSIEAALAPGARVDVNSHSGSITLRLPADTSASFDISTFSGSVANDLGPAAQRIDRFGPGKALEFSLGDGSAEVSVETFSGSVSLKRQ
ncbi:MAG: DUF4097 family beta strand repeat-containing protein [Thermoanaerobaculia bacterium]